MIATIIMDAGLAATGLYEFYIYKAKKLLVPAANKCHLVFQRAYKPCLYMPNQAIYPQMALHASGKLRKNGTGDSMTNEMRESKMENARWYSSFSRIGVIPYMLVCFILLFLPSIRIGTLVLKAYCGNNMKVVFENSTYFHEKYCQK